MSESVENTPSGNFQLDPSKFFPDTGAASPSDPLVREAVFRAFKGRCFYTGESLSRTDCRIDHIFPVSRGGPDNIYNFALASDRINSKKSASIDRQRIEGVLYVIATSFAPKAIDFLKKRRKRASPSSAGSDKVVKRGRWAGYSLDEAMKRARSSIRSKRKWRRRKEMTYGRAAMNSFTTAYIPLTEDGWVRLTIRVHSGGYTLNPLDKSMTDETLKILRELTGNREPDSLATVGNAVLLACHRLCGVYPGVFGECLLLDYLSEDIFYHISGGSYSSDLKEAICRLWPSLVFEPLRPVRPPQYHPDAPPLFRESRSIDCYDWRGLDPG